MINHKTINVGDIFIYNTDNNLVIRIEKIGPKLGKMQLCTVKAISKSKNIKSTNEWDIYLYDLYFFYSKAFDGINDEHLLDKVKILDI